MPLRGRWVLQLYSLVCTNYTLCLAHIVRGDGAIISKCLVLVLQSLSQVVVVSSESPRLARNLRTSNLFLGPGKPWSNPRVLEDQTQRPSSPAYESGNKARGSRNSHFFAQSSQWQRIESFRRGIRLFNTTELG